MFHEYLYEIKPSSKACKLPHKVLEGVLRHAVFVAVTELSDGPVLPYRVFNFPRQDGHRRFVVMVLEKKEELEAKKGELEAAYGGGEPTPLKRRLDAELAKQLRDRDYGTIRSYEFHQDDIESDITSVEVEIDFAHRLAVPDHPNIRLAGDVWELAFIGVPEGYQASVVFVRFQPLEGPAEPVTRGPFEKMTLSANQCVLEKRTGPAGKYWWKVVLVPRGSSTESLVRLHCAPWVAGQAGGGLELTGEPD